MFSSILDNFIQHERICFIEGKSFMRSLKHIDGISCQINQHTTVPGRERAALARVENIHKTIINSSQADINGAHKKNIFC